MVYLHQYYTGAKTKRPTPIYNTPTPNANTNTNTHINGNATGVCKCSKERRVETQCATRGDEMVARARTMSEIAAIGCSHDMRKPA